jgi:hypothetical protein
MTTIFWGHFYAKKARSVENMNHSSIQPKKNRALSLSRQRMSGMFNAEVDYFVLVCRAINPED